MAGAAGRFACPEMWGWDGEYALDIMKRKIQEGRDEYVQFLGVGNEMGPRAMAMFSDGEDMAAGVVARWDEVNCYHVHGYCVSQVDFVIYDFL